MGSLERRIADLERLLMITRIFVMTINMLMVATSITRIVHKVAPCG
jgi:hypothetical protein